MSEPFAPAGDRYDRPKPWFRTCGRSGLKLPALSLGCWHNFGDPGTDSARHTDEPTMHEHAKSLLFTAFDLGITHFDLANNYGPPPGSAEARVGRVLHQELAPYRDELIISSKAGYLMWPGPYGEWNSRKSLLASLDQSLARLRLDYVDIFYSHRPDPPVAEGGAPLEETMGALDHAVRSGKALYAGISNYGPDQTLEALRVCDAHGFVKPIIHQPKYSMLDRWIEPQLVPVCRELGLGTMVFSPLAQGLLSDRYLEAVPADSRAASASQFLSDDRITPELVAKLRTLNDVAQRRGQSLAQMALAWVLRDQGPGRGAVTSALIGASRPEQLKQNAAAIENTDFADDELIAIDSALG